MRISDWSSDVCSSDLPLAREAQAVSSAAVSRSAVGDRDTFVARFGGVFEHSPWIAAAAFDAGLPEGPPTAARLHACMVAALRAATQAQTRAHNAAPDRKRVV